jgi:hypothetical protein
MNIFRLLLPSPWSLGTSKCTQHPGGRRLYEINQKRIAVYALDAGVLLTVSGKFLSSFRSSELRQFI